ncbi:hypothetical protein M9H77_23179 [Catharanthus roseus]|uniref:Uncharacterized protein n=1 Tax=Catharanthus roseus TaxID=4058 RepID=A0ACC0AWL3_CATRO|nr:hypothetical protein M9H77_23179 [Catharanthus roseus]
MKVVVTVLIIKEEMLTVESTLVVPTSLQEGKMELVPSLHVIDPLSILLINSRWEIELRLHTRGIISCGKSSQSLKQASRLCSHNLESLPTLYGKVVPTYYLEWESEVEHLFDAYNVDENDKAVLASCSFSLRFWNTYSLIEGGNEYQYLEEVSMVDELLQAKIQINKSVEMHVVGEMSKEDFGDSMSYMNFEEEENIELERKDRVEEKERLVEKSSFFVSIYSLVEKCKKDESSKEEENDLEDNERTKEISEEKRENSKEELNVFEKKHGGLLIFLNSLGIYLEKRYFIDFNSISCTIPRVDENDLNVANHVSCVLGVEDRRSMENELGLIFDTTKIDRNTDDRSRKNTEEMLSVNITDEHDVVGNSYRRHTYNFLTVTDDIVADVDVEVSAVIAARKRGIIGRNGIYDSTALSSEVPSPNQLHTNDSGSPNQLQWSSTGDHGSTQRLSILLGLPPNLVKFLLQLKWLKILFYYINLELSPPHILDWLRDLRPSVGIPIEPLLEDSCDFTCKYNDSRESPRGGLQVEGPISGTVYVDCEADDCEVVDSCCILGGAGDGVG